MQKQEIEDTNLETLSHATELASKVITKVAGEAVATTVNGEIFSTADIKNGVAAKMQACLLDSQGSNNR